MECDHILNSGTARFQRLTAYHPTITSKYTENLGSTLSATYPRSLFTIFCNLEVFAKHIYNFVSFNANLVPLIKKMLKFCSRSSKVYQVIFNFKLLRLHSSKMSIS